MKSRRFKKGFTLVELLVVIAILAVLAGVSVIAYFGFTSQARTSADEQAVTQMNIALEAQEAIDAPDNVEEAKDVLEAAGFSVDDYVPLDKDNIFYYDENEVRVLIFDQEEEKVTFPQELAELYSTVSMKQGFWFPLNDKTYIWQDLGLESLGTVEGNKGTNFRDIISKGDDTTLFKLTDDLNLNNLYFVDDPFLGSFFPTNDNGNLNLDLNGHTISILPRAQVGGYRGFSGYEDPQECDITISNGTIDFTGVSASFLINENSTLTLDNCKIVTTTSPSSELSYNQFSVADGGRLTLSGCTLEASQGDTCSVFLGGKRSETNIFNSTLTATSYGITSNAGEGQSDDIRVKVYNSSVTTLNGSAVLVNVKGTYEFEGSSFTGDGIGVSIRVGNASIKDCVITEKGENTDWKTEIGTPDFSQCEATSGAFANGVWGNGDMVQPGALVLGDWNAGSYNYDTYCKVSNTKIYMNDEWTELPIVYLSQDGSCTTTLEYDESSCKFYKGDVAYSKDDAIQYVGKDGAKPTDTSISIGNIIINDVKVAPAA